MDLSILKKRTVLVLGGLLAMTVGAGTMQAATNSLITVGALSGAVTCNTATGPGTGRTFAVTPKTALTSSQTIIVTPVLPTGLAITPTTGTLTFGAPSVTFTVTSVAAPCNGFTTGSGSITFTDSQTGTVVATNPDTATASVTETLLTASNISAAPASLTFTCSVPQGGGARTASGVQHVALTAASGSQTFSATAPTWLTIAASGTATTTPGNFNATPVAGCASFTPGTTTTGSLSFQNTTTNATDQPLVVPVSMVTEYATPLTQPAPATLTYVKGSEIPQSATITVASTVSPSPYFQLDTTTVPAWLSANVTSGTATTTGAVIQFTSTQLCDNMAPGTYTATIHLKVSNSFDQTATVSLFLNDKAPTLTVSGSLSRQVNWTIGTALPTFVITAVSSDSPIPYTATASGTAEPIVNADEQQGLVYSFGSPINVSFNAAAFAAAQPGTVLTGTVTLTWGSSNSTVVVSLTINVVPPGATVSALSPSTLPASAAPNTFYVSIIGTGFVVSNDPTQRTRVGFVNGGNIVPDSNITSWTVVSPTLINVTIAVPTGTDPYLNFATATTATSQLGVCNPTATIACPVFSGSQTLTISAGPLIQAVTSASSFVQVTPPALPSFAAYDIVSIFGAGFCPGCASNQVLQGAPDPVTLRYLPTPGLSPDASLSPAPANPHYVTVSFLNHTSGALIATAPLLFATNGQINLLVPGAVPTGTADIQVNYGYGASGSATLSQSARFPVTIAAADPGVFTVNSDGQGQAAALDLNYNLISPTNPAGLRTGAVHAGDSDIIQLYVTGLGIPDTTASWGTTCMPVTTFVSALAGATGATITAGDIDGTIIQAGLLAGEYPPCLASNNANLPVVTIGGIQATVKYAGFVADSIAGLYQIDVLLPSSVQTSPNYFVPLSGVANEVGTLATPMQLPIVITSGTTNGAPASQQGVTLWVAPRLYVTAPSLSTCTTTAPFTCAVGVAWPASAIPNSVKAVEGTPPYNYALSSGVLPAGLTLNATSGLISGTPAAGTGSTYPVTVTVTDSATYPVTGSVSFNIIVAQALVVTPAGGGNTPGVYGTASYLTPVLTPTGGVAPYTYAITAPLPSGAPPNGMTVGTGANAGEVASAIQTPAGTYTVAVTATDSSSTPLTGSVTSDVTIALLMSNSTITTQTHASSGILTQVSAAGNTGTITWSLDTPSMTAGFSIDSSGNITQPTGSAVTMNVTATATDGSLAPGAKTGGYATGSIQLSLTTN